MGLQYFKVKTPIAVGLEPRGDDVTATKTALQELGLYRPGKYGVNEFSDNRLFQGIAAFQRREGVASDGVIKAGGPTERLINAAVFENRAPGLSDRPELGLDAAVGSAAANRPADVRRVKRALSLAGYYPERRTAPDHPARDALDDNLEFGLEVFQRQFNTGKDGRIAPGSHTERTLARVVRPMQLAQADSGSAGVIAQASGVKPVDRDKWAAAGFGGPRGPLHDVPTINLWADRKKSIFEDSPARFDFEDKVGLTGKIDKYYIWPEIGQDAVAEHNTIIEQEAKRIGVDPDLVRAIMYAENAAGWYDIINPWRRSVRPMNINPTYWRGLAGLTPENAYDPRINIRAGALLIKQIAERLDDPTPRNIAFLYNGLAIEKITDKDDDFGARVDYAYRTKEWEKK